MRCEVVAVGTELLLGQIVDTNSSWIGEQLALAGIDSHFQTKVGDNWDRMEDCIRLALERNDAVIICGGLGPTQDDITRDVIAKVMGAPLIRQPEIGDKIRAMFEKRGRRMTENNLRQADVPEGASVIPEMPGTAPGLICPVGDKVIYAVPGVPYEMREMVGGTVLPDLQRRAGVSAVIRSRVLRTWGESESGLAELLADRIDQLDATGSATLAFQASGIEGLKVRITVKEVDEAAAVAALAAEEALVREILGDCIFALDEDTMETVVLDRLRQRGLTLAVAEALTGGLVGNRLTDVPGAHEVFHGAMVAHSDSARATLLGMTEGAEIVQATAGVMAGAVRERLNTDVGLAAIAPEAPRDRMVGTVFLGLAHDGRIDTGEVRLPGDRNRLRQYTVISLLDFLRRRLD